jgi:hypothetical protein
VPHLHAPLFDAILTMQHEKVTSLSCASLYRGVINSDSCGAANADGSAAAITRIGDICISPLSINWCGILNVEQTQAPAGVECWVGQGASMLDGHQAPILGDHCMHH